VHITDKPNTWLDTKAWHNITEIKNAEVSNTSKEGRADSLNAACMPDDGQLGQNM
jgi:hypothetical protein